MPDPSTLKRAEKDQLEGKSASTQAGEFVREEMRHIRDGKHGARSARQAIAIGLSKARRAGVRLPPPQRGRLPESTRRQAERDLARGDHNRKRPTSRKRSKATLDVLRREGATAASHSALARQARRAASRRRPAERSAAARKSGRTRRTAIQEGF
jgi:hypothetical protein